MYLAIQNAQINDDDVRIGWHNGRPHLISGVVAVQEQILKGELLPRSEIAASAASFSGRPLPVAHPTDAESDEFVSANSPDVWDSEVVGKLFDTAENDGQLTGDVWIDIPKSIALGGNSAARYAGPLALLATHLDGGIQALGKSRDDGGAGLGDDVIAALSKLAEELGATDDPESGDGESTNAAGLLEVSTAYWYEPNGQTGTHNGEEYSSEQLNVKPDHLALLPTQIGECSVSDGCGAPRANSGELSPQTVMADGGQPVENGGGETEFAFAADHDRDGNALGGDGSGSVPDSEDAGKGFLAGIMTGLRSFGLDADGENGGSGGNEEQENETNTMKDSELANLLGVNEGFVENLSASNRKAYEALAEEKKDEQPDDPDGGDGGGSDEPGDDPDGDGGDDPDDDPDGSDDPDDTGNSGDRKVADMTVDELKSTVSETTVATINSQHERGEKEQLVVRIGNLDPEADFEALMETPKPVLESHLSTLMGQAGGQGGGGFGFNQRDMGGANGGQGGSGGDSFAAKVNEAQANEGEDEDGWGSGELSAAHTGESYEGGDGGSE